MKIPWKNLYSAPVVAEVDGLYIIAGPSSGRDRKVILSVMLGCGENGSGDRV